jgi:hypothetical protein
MFGASVAGVSLALSAPTYAADVSSASVLASARAAIASQTGVHVAFTAHSGSTGITEKIIADVGTTAGTETIFEGSADVAIRVTPTFAYVSGNSSGLTKLFGMSSATAKKLGTRWEAWKAGTKQYANLRSDVTMRSVSDLLPKAKGTKVVPDSRHGATLDVLTWATAATATVPKLSNRLVVSAQGAALPISQTTTATGGTKITTALSKWGETVTIEPPAADRTVSSSHIGI